MSRRATVVGLAAFCVLALGAIPAPGAFAGATAFTCVAGAGAANTGVDCEPGSSGTSGHEAIPEGTEGIATTLTATKLTNPVLESRLFGVSVKLEATGIECLGCTLRDNEIGGVMEAAGTGGTLTFTGVKLVGLEEKCEVVGTKSEDIATRPLRFTTTASTGATLEPVEGTILAEFNVKAKTGKECTVAGNNLKVTGKAAGTLTGAKLTVNVTKASGEMQLEGEKAALKGEGTLEAGLGSTHHPVALTTGAFAGATAFTCVAGAGAANTGVDCEPGSGGTSGHEAIPEGTEGIATTLTATKLTNPVLEGKVFGVSVKLEATGVECLGCTLRNSEIGGVMEAAGTGTTLTFTGVKLVGLEEKCEVVGIKSEDITTRPLKFTTTVTTGATLEPVEGTTLAEFNIKAKAGKECAAAGNNLKVTGKAAATFNGAKLSVNVTKVSGEMQLEGEKAALKGEGTLEAGLGSTHHPVALT